MKRVPNLKTAMTPFPYSIDLNASLADAKALMARHEVRHLPVTEAHQPVGILTERDMNMILARDSQSRNVDAYCVRDVYTADAYIVDLNEPLENVLATMAERHIGSALVIKHGHLAGVFTAVDACRSYAELLHEHFPQPGGGEAA